MLMRAERLHRQFFQVHQHRFSRPAWEPPVDVLETEREVLIIVALPGVDPVEVDASIEQDTLVLAGQRILPPELHTAIIHRLELPQGRFERRVILPPGRYSAIRRRTANGCLVFILPKAM